MSKEKKEESFTLSLVSLLAISFLSVHVILSLEYPTIPRRALAVFLARVLCRERRSSWSLHRTDFARNKEKMKANAAKAAPFGREHVNRQTYTCAGAKKKKENV